MMTSTMDSAAIEAWMNYKETAPQQDYSLQTGNPACLRRPLSSRPKTQVTYQDRDWTNPNRFSDPLHRASRPAPFPGLCLPGRPSKAYTWYVGSDQCQGTACNRHQHSLFPSCVPQSQALDEDAGRRRRRNGASFTWERVRQQQTAAARVAETRVDADSAVAAVTSGRISPFVLARRIGLKPLGAQQGCATYSYGSHWASHRTSGSQISSPSPSALRSLGGSQTGSPRCSQRSSLSPQPLGISLIGSPCSQRSSPSPQPIGSPLTGSPCSSRRSSPTPYMLGSHLPSSQLNSPCSSRRSSPNRSPQSTLTRLSPALLNRSSPSHRLSPTVGLGGAVGGALHAPAQLRPSRSSFVSQWVSSSSASPSLRLSPCSARSSQTSSGHGEDDISFGSETDDEFLYVSCQQLTKGLGDLTITMTKPLPQYERVVENPSFLPQAGGSHYAEEEEEVDFDGCSDDALSDDVFLDNPQFPPAAKTSSPGAQPVLEAKSRNQVFGGERTKAGGSSHTTYALTTLQDNRTCESDPKGVHGSFVSPSLSLGSNQSPSDERGEGDGRSLDSDASGGADHSAMMELAAVESLRRNSLQSKLRQTWRHRRHKAAQDAELLNGSQTDTSSAEERVSSTPSLSDQKNITNSSFAGSARPELIKDDDDDDEEENTGSSEAKPRFYYVISPTDDVNMPDVIAVRRSSVELIRWQNSLRRRRRRQAKRHDLGRNKKKEPRQSATV